MLRAYVSGFRCFQNDLVSIFPSDLVSIFPSMFSCGFGVSTDCIAVCLLGFTHRIFRFQGSARTLQSSLTGD